MKDKGRPFEDYIANRDQGHVNALSGAGCIKEDVTSKLWLSQCKFTDNKSYSIKLQDLKVLSLNAMKQGLRPKLDLSFSWDNYVILKEKDFLGLINGFNI